MVNIDSIFFDTQGRSNCTFQVYVGGRGVGKTYPTLRSLLFNEEGDRIIPAKDEKFLYVRRLQKEIEICASANGNPFKALNRDYDLSIEASFKSKEGFAKFHEVLSTVENDITVQQDMILGYGASLSTFAGLRGVDLSDVSTLVFDEFIEEEHMRKIRGEGSAFLNMVETINRNREFMGKAPVKVYLLSNSISLTSNILLEMHAVPTMAAMIKNRQHRCTVRERDLYIEMIENREFIEFKRNTALYKLARGTDFEQQSIFNRFLDDDFSMIKSLPINEFKPIFNFNEYTFLKHKTRSEYYIVHKIIKAPKVYERSQADILKKSFSLGYNMLSIHRQIYYDDYATKIVFDEIMK